MPPNRLFVLPLALLLAAGSAGAQRWGGSPQAGGRHGSPSAAKQPAAGSWNGTPSKWGGSPAPVRTGPRAGIAYVIPGNAYIPVAVAAPAPVAATYVDTVYVAEPGPVEMPVVAPRREPRQLTTIEVYRLQPRFRKP